MPTTCPCHPEPIGTGRGSVKLLPLSRKLEFSSKRDRSDPWSSTPTYKWELRHGKGISGTQTPAMVAKPGAHPSPPHRAQTPPLPQMPSSVESSQRHKTEVLGARDSGQVRDGSEGGERVATAGQAPDQGKACRPILTCALAFLESVARLAGDSLVAAEGAYCVHAVLAPAARVQVRHTLVDVCRERDAVRDCAQRAARAGAECSQHCPRGAPHPE